MLFGSLHLGAWNFKFPTLVEEIMWKAAVLVTIGLPIVVPPVYAIQWLLVLRAAPTLLSSETNINFLWIAHVKEEKINWLYDFWKDLSSYPLLCVSFFLYLIARLTIIAIAFSSLSAMPDSAYIATWTKNIPKVE